jgi:hypothetical protein
VDGDFGHIPGFAAALAHSQISQPRLSFTNPNWQYIMHITGLHAKRNENAHFNIQLIQKDCSSFENYKLDHGAHCQVSSFLVRC